MALAFNLGSFVVEYAVIVAHVRLLTELKDRADRLREERYGSERRTPSESGTRPVARARDRRSLFREVMPTVVADVPARRCHLNMPHEEDSRSR